MIPGLNGIAEGVWTLLMCQTAKPGFSDSESEADANAGALPIKAGPVKSDFPRMVIYMVILLLMNDTQWYS